MTEEIPVSQPDTKPTTDAVLNADKITREGRDIIFRIQNLAEAPDPAKGASGEDKFVYFMVSGRPATVLSVTNQMTHKNLTPDEQTRVWAAYAKEFPATKADIPSEESRILADKRKQTRADADAKDPDLALVSTPLPKPEEPPAKAPAPETPNQKKTPRKGKKADGPH